MYTWMDIILMLSHGHRDRHQPAVDLQDHDLQDHDLQDQDVNERIMHSLDAERQQDNLQLESEAQNILDHENNQLHDDVLYHEDELTNEIIAAAKSLYQSSDDDHSVQNMGPYNKFYNEYNCDVYQEPDDSSEDELNENTDTDDGKEDIIEVLGANTRLIALLQKQRKTIARLRARISRLIAIIADGTPGVVVHNFESSVHIPLRVCEQQSSDDSASASDGILGRKATNSNSTTTGLLSKGLVLMDSFPDVTLRNINAKFSRISGHKRLVEQV